MALGWLRGKGRTKVGSAQRRGSSSHGSRSNRVPHNEENIPSSPSKQWRNSTAPSSIHRTGRMSARTRRTRIKKYLERLADEAKDLEKVFSKLYNELARAREQHEDLSGKIEALIENVDLQTRNQNTRETLLGRLLKLVHWKRESGNSPEKRHLQRQLNRTGLRKDYIEAHIMHLARLILWVDGEVKIQKEHQKQAESGEDGLLDFDELLEEVLDEQKARRQVLNKKHQEEGRPLTTQEAGREFILALHLGNKKPSFQPSSQIFREKLHIFVQKYSPDKGKLSDPFGISNIQPRPTDYAQQRLEGPKASKPVNVKQEDTSAQRPTHGSTRKSADRPTTSDFAADPLEPSFRRLSIKTPCAPLPCRHNQWLSRPKERFKCQSCNEDSFAVVYYCPKCPAEICVSCFRAAQPGGGRVAVSSRIFAKLPSEHLPKTYSER